MQKVSPPPPAVSVSESHLAAVYFFGEGGVRDCVAAVVGAPSPLQLRLKVTAGEVWQARQAPGGANHFDGELVSLMRKSERGKCAVRSNKSFCHCYSVFWVWREVFLSHQKKCDRGRLRRASRNGSLWAAHHCAGPLWESYLCLQHTHWEADLWSKSRLDQSWLSSASSGRRCRRGGELDEESAQPHVAILQLSSFCVPICHGGISSHALMWLYLHNSIHALYMHENLHV